MKNSTKLLLALFVLYLVPIFLPAQNFWTSVNPSSGWPSNPIFHPGMIAIDKTENGAGIGLFNSGFAQNPQFFIDNGTWGGLKYGLSRGKINLSLQTSPVSGSRTPILMQSFYGLGFKTNWGRVSFGENGIMTIGLDDNQLQRIANEPPNHLYKLYVRGGIRTNEVKVDLSDDWPDYVFEKTYFLSDLEAVEQYIIEKNHLPGIPSAAHMESHGVELGEITRLQQEKIEELFLYVIELKKEIKTLKADRR